MTTYSSKKNGYYLSEVATFGAAAPVAGDTWLYVPHLGTEPLGHAPQFDTQQEANSMGASTVPYFTVSGGSFPIKVRAHTGSLGLDGAGGDAVGTATYPFQKLFESYWGAAGVATFAGSTVASGGPGKSVALVLTSGTGIVVGMALMFASGAIRVVKAITVNTVTLDQDLTTASDYTASAVVYGGMFFKPTVTQYAKHLYLTHVQDGIVDMIGPGRVTGFKTSMTEKKEIVYEFTLSAAHYYPRTGITPTAIPVQTLVGTPLVATNGVASVGGTAYAVKGLAVMGCMNHVEQQTATTSGATDGISGWYAPSVDGGSIEFETVLATTIEDAWLAVTPAEVRVDFTGGSTAAARARAGLSIYAVNATPDAPRQDVDGQRGNKVKYTPRLPSAADATAGLMPMAMTLFGCI